MSLLKCRWCERMVSYTVEAGGARLDAHMQSISSKCTGSGAVVPPPMTGPCLTFVTVQKHRPNRAERKRTAHLKREKDMWLAAQTRKRIDNARELALRVEREARFIRLISVLEGRMEAAKQ